MVHLRINERECRPNEYINWITALPMPDAQPPNSEEDARHLLRALAAQVRPVMKKHGITVNSLEEYEDNSVFLGRNWNGGENIELVLRKANGSFRPVAYILSTFCHELSHCHHQNHGPDFQKLMCQLRNEVWALQSKGYYGDGYWSSGSRLIDSETMRGDGIEPNFDFPEYECGGAQTSSKPKSMKRRRAGFAGPSNRTGAQTEKRRKAGARVTAPGKFTGEGKQLNDHIADERAKAKGSGFRKQANSKKAKEERALAAERRLLALQGKSETKKEEESLTDEDDSDVEVIGVVETDEDRRKLMRDATSNDERNSMRNFMADFYSSLPPNGHKQGSGNHDRPSSSKHVKESTPIDEKPAKQPKVEAEPKHEVGSFKQPSSSKLVKEWTPLNDLPGQKPKVESDLKQGAGSSNRLSSSKPAQHTTSTDSMPVKRLKLEPIPSIMSQVGASQSQKPSKTGLVKNIVQEEIVTQRRDSLGLNGSRKLGSQPHSLKPERDDTAILEETDRQDLMSHSNGAGWTCQVCTLDNLPLHLACAVCNTPRGQTQVST